MPEGIHDIPGAWLTEILGEISEGLQKVARCGRPEVKHVGTKSIKRKDGLKGPDLFLRLLTRFDQDVLHISVGARVVLETAYSQSLPSVMSKVFDYLHDDAGNTHAVIVRDMSYPLTLVRDFKVDIGVWVKPETGNLGKSHKYAVVLLLISASDEDYPLEDFDCNHMPRATPPPSSLSQSPTPGQHVPLSPVENDKEASDHQPAGPELSSPSSNAYSGSTLVTEDRTRVDHSDKARVYTRGSKSIWRRTEKPIVRFPGSLYLPWQQSYDQHRWCTMKATQR